MSVCNTLRRVGESIESRRRTARRTGRVDHASDGWFPVNSVGRWLEELGLGRYADAFAENDIDDDVLTDLTEADLERLGVRSLGHRKRLLQAIRARVATSPPDMLAAARDEQAERRQLTVMFADLVGSTVLSAMRDPEEVRDTMRAFQDRATTEIERYEGFVARYMGDGILAYFGFPQAHEDDAERAVHAGLSIAQATASDSQLDSEAKSDQLPVRVGIETGLVVVGDLIGRGAAQESAVVGETPNVAARLQGLAAPGTVVVGPGTRNLLGESFECEDLGPREVRGLPEPLPLWRVVSVREAVSRFASLRGASRTALVGREEELGLLRARWTSACEGAGRIVAVTGEPGVGKSRLVDALSVEVESASCARVLFQCSPLHTHSALHPFVIDLSRAAGITASDSMTRRDEKLRDALGSRTAGGDDAFHLLADLVAPGLEVPSAIAALGPDHRRNLTQAALLQRIVDQTAAGALLVVFEDAHWIDASSLELLAQLVERAVALPMLVVVTARSEFEPPWLGRAGTTLLALSRMQPASALELSRSIAAGRLPPELLDRIVARADGVPLFVEELTRAALETPADAHGGSDAAFPIPPTLHDLLVARLDRLHRGKRIAQVGAVLGRTFSHEALALVSEHLGESPEAAVAELVAAGLLLRRRAASGVGYEFKHALVQDVAYQTLLRAERRRLHRAVGEALIVQAADGDVSEPESVARHLTEAGEIARAIPYWRRAGERAAARAAHLDAVSHLGRARDLAGEDAAAPSDVVELIGIDVALAASFRVVGRSDDAFVALARAEALADAHGRIADLSRIHYQRGNLYYPRGEYENTLREHQQSLALAREAGSSENEVRALGGLGDAFYSCGRMRSAHEQFDQCVTLAGQAGFADIEVANLPMRGMTRVFLNRLREARADYERAIERASQLGHLRAEMIAQIGVSRPVFDLGELDAAVQHLDRARELANRLHSRAFLPAVMATVCRMWHLQGRQEEAVAELEKADALSRETGRRFAGARVLGAMALLTTDPERRRAALAEGEALLADGSVGHNYYWFYRDAIEASLGAGEWDEATRYADALEAFARPEPVAFSSFFARRGRALAEVGRGSGDIRLAGTLAELVSEAEAAGLKEPAAALSDALAAVGAG